MKAIFLFGALLITARLFSQESRDSVGQYNDRHKKTGLWMVYLDEYTNKVDKEDAVFIGYELYDDGECVFPFVGYNARKYTVEFDGVKGAPGSPVPLTGNHRLLLKNNITFEAVYKDGRPVLMKAYRYDKKGERCMKEVLDFTNQYQGTDGTFYYQLYHYDFVRLEGYYRKGNKSWGVQ